MDINGSQLGQKSFVGLRSLGTAQSYGIRNKTRGTMDISLGPQFSGIQQVATHGIGSSIKTL